MRTVKIELELKVEHLTKLETFLESLQGDNSQSGENPQAEELKQEKPVAPKPTPKKPKTTTKATAETEEKPTNGTDVLSGKKEHELRQILREKVVSLAKSSPHARQEMVGKLQSLGASNVSTLAVEHIPTMLDYVEELSKTIDQ